ncbi:hypothetical protein F3Y22_tig00001349pilonHSYRG00076 [Hibiscus syriacus]|uniref:Chromo domain-containing protein n=1 Tax=Hibiscus syriacus TaxID=106335 RepID=A0A6A3D1N4_HIBSY|nr:hypothetical protein F3Y22_tig00001349pilonHSYRG00076 [Hibiscus syriacus]
MRSSIHPFKSESGPLGKGNNSFVAKKNNVVSYEVEKGKSVDCRSKERNEQVVSSQVTRSRSSAQPSMYMSGLSGACNTSTVAKQDGTVPTESIRKSRQQLDVHELLESKFVRPVYNTVYCGIKTEEKGKCRSKARSEDVFTRSRSYVQSPKFENSSTGAEKSSTVAKQDGIVLTESIKKIGLEHVVVVELLQYVKLVDDDVTCMVVKEERGRFQSKVHLKERGICSVGNYTRYSANTMLSGLVADKKIMCTHLMEYEGVLRWTILDSRIYSREEEYSSGYEGSTLLSWYREIIDKTIILINVVNAKTYENRIKQHTDKNRSERQFQIGEEVYLKLQPYRQMSIALRKNMSLLKKYIGDSSSAATAPPAVDKDGQFRIQPLKILARRIVNRNSKPVTKLLVRWENLDESNDTWEDYLVLKGRFLGFDPWGQGSSRGAGIVMVGEEEERRGEEDLGMNERGEELGMDA